MAGLFVAAASLWPATAAAQSFDCRSARSPNELVICREPGLARLDQQLAALQRSEIGKLPNEDRQAFEDHGVLFLNARRRCGESRRCIEQSYINRIKEFQEFLAASQPDEAKSGTSPEPSSERQTSRRTRSTDASRQPEAGGTTTGPVRSSDVAVQVEPSPPSTPKASADTAPKRRAKRDSTSRAAAAAQSEARPTRAASTEGSGGSAPTIQWVNPPPAR